MTRGTTTGTRASKSVNPDVMESCQADSERTDEVLDQASKLEALCAVQSLIAAEGLSVPAQYQYSFSRVLESQARELRQLLAELLD